MSNEPGDGLDEQRVTEMAYKIMDLVNDNFKRGPSSRDRVYEVLNALACSAAIVIRGCEDPEALEWFSQALNNQLR